MKSRTTAAFLALFLGGFGVHRFYLNQSGLGLFYLFASIFLGNIVRMPFGVFLGVIDAISFFMMSDEEFDRRYNKDKDQVRARREQQRRRMQSGQSRRQTRPTSRRDSRRRPQPDARRDRQVTTQRQRKMRTQKRNPFKLSGQKKLDAFDLPGAIEDFNRSIDLHPDDPQTHYKLASAYSLSEKSDEAFKHLSIAVAQGFNDYERIKSDDAFAFLRIHPEFDAFEKAGYQRHSTLNTAPRQESSASADQPMDQTLLAQLQRLAEMRKKGLITDEDFEVEKRRIMR